MRRAAVLLTLGSLTPEASASAPAACADQLPPRAVPGPERWGHGRLVVGDGAPGLLALTFDDGPSQATTGAILDELDRRGAPAAFFVNPYRLAGRSEAATRQRALLEREEARGDPIGNHTFDHQRLSDLAPEAQAKEILDGESSIARVLGDRPWLFRPPYGRMTREAAKLTAERGYTVVLWNISSEDPYLRTPDKVLARVMDEVRHAGGGVVLFHDTHPWTAAALPRFFDALAEENCRRVAAGEPAYLVVALDRFVRPRYGEPPSAPELAARAEADRAARRRIAERCAEKGGSEMRFGERPE
jgi:peptidoglycan/xylan/chitin deacetylase (PgdA/CDA1 family)